MNISKDELIKVLSQFNPWWRGEAIADLPTWERAIFQELLTWVYEPPAPRAVLLSGARQVGKTTLLQQVINKLLKEGIPPANILYVTFDHPIIKMAGIEPVLEAWREREPKSQGPDYLFLDEMQFMSDWGTWVKHQVDFVKDRRIVFTGSAMPLISSEQESGVGRWHTIRLTTLSFYEYLQLKHGKDLQEISRFEKETFPGLKDVGIKKAHNAFKEYIISFFDKVPTLELLKELFEWPQSKFYEINFVAGHLAGYFHEYLVIGGFPQTAIVDSVTQAQRLLREDIIDKVLKRDMTAFFGVRRVLELEQIFLYLCMHDGGLLDMRKLCENLNVKRPTAQSYIELLEATHLIYRLRPFGYGKDILRAKFKIYLADAAISSAVLLKGKSILDDPTALGIAAEAAVFKHLCARYSPQDVRFTYWQDKKQKEIDLVAQVGDRIIPFEVKYRAEVKDLKGLLRFCKEKSIEYAYVITKSLDDFGPLEKTEKCSTRIMRIPAAFLCYWLGESELSQSEFFG